MGLVKNTKPENSAEHLIEIGKTARAWTTNNGGRILSLYWPQDWENQIIITFEGRGKEQAETCFHDLEKEHGVEIVAFRALTQGEKEHEQRGILWNS